MNLKHLKDSELLSQTKLLVQTEREVLTKVLHHLREVDRRKLFSDLGYQSLFEYAVKDLKYSEGQAGRRIQAMRLIKEIPELEQKIESGDLSLSNISQAQSYFREAQKAAPQLKIDSSEKLKVLKSLENKSVREGQKVLISLQPQTALPREREKVLDDSHTQASFVKTKDLSQQLDEVRSLLGLKGASLSLAELIGEMAVISIRELKIRKFGKKRTDLALTDVICRGTAPMGGMSRNIVVDPFPGDHESHGSQGHIEFENKSAAKKTDPPTTPESRSAKNPRYISPAIRHQVWNRDERKCRICNSKRYLNFDHIKPIAHGGLSSVENLRLLCSQCNQRQAIKIFGADRIPGRGRFRWESLSM